MGKTKTTSKPKINNPELHNICIYVLHVHIYYIVFTCDLFFYQMIAIVYYYRFSSMIKIKICFDKIFKECKRNMYTCIFYSVYYFN